MISTSAAHKRDELLGNCGERKKRSRYGPVPQQIQTLVRRTIRVVRESFAGALRPPHSPLETGAGHAVPTRRVLSARRVFLWIVPAPSRRALNFHPVPARNRPAGRFRRSAPIPSGDRIAAQLARRDCRKLSNAPT